MRRIFFLVAAGLVLLSLTGCKQTSESTEPDLLVTGSPAITLTDEAGKEPSPMPDGDVSDPEKDPGTDLEEEIEGDSGIYLNNAYGTENGLPVIYLTTENSQAITSTDTYVNGTMRIDVGTAEVDPALLFDGAIQIRGRGNSTWMAAKKPYKIKLEEKTPLFSMGASKHWVLLANYYDGTLMRNLVSQRIAKAMDFLTMDSVSVDVYLNGEYQGNYQLCEQIRVSKTRVQIFDWENAIEGIAEDFCIAESELSSELDLVADAMLEDMSWLTTKSFVYNGKTYDMNSYLSEMPSLTGGVLLELDDTYDEPSKFKTKSGQPIMISSPEYAATNEELFSYVKEYVQAVEDAVTAPNFKTTYRGNEVSYMDLIDVDSFVDYFLLTEVFANLDSMFKSTYLYLDVDGKLTMGPLWDFDLSAGGSMVIEWTEYYDKWQTTYRSLSAAQGVSWYRSLIKDKNFVELVKARYHELRDTTFADLTAAGGLIDTFEEILQESGNANYSLWGNGSMWGDFSDFGWGTYNNPTANKGSYADEVAKLRDWMEKRLKWLDENIDLL